MRSGHAATLAPDGATERHIPELDGLRALAVGFVVLWHYVGISDEGALYSIFRLGRSGVDLFFVLSGFLITSILLRNRGSPSYYRTFYTRRAARILPVYFLLLAAFFALRANGGSPALFGSEGFNAWTYPVFLQNIEMSRSGAYGADFLGHTWSLAVEEQFYLLFPLMVALLPVRWLPALLLAVAGAAIVLRAAAYIHFGYFPSYVLTPMRADCLAAGALLAWTVQHRPALLASARAGLTAAFAVLVALIPIIWLIPRETANWHMAMWGHSYYTLLYAVTLAWVLSNRDRAWLWPLRTPVAAGLGAISYALYLFHWPMFRGVFLVFGAAPSVRTAEGAALVLLALSLSIGLAAASYFIVEQPAIRLGRRFSYAPRGPDAVQDSGSAQA